MMTMLPGGLRNPRPECRSLAAILVVKDDLESTLILVGDQEISCAVRGGIVDDNDFPACDLGR